MTKKQEGEKYSKKENVTLKSAQKREFTQKRTQKVILLKKVLKK